MAQKMGASLALLMNVSSNPESSEVKAARADMEVEMLEADLAHHQVFARLRALMGERYVKTQFRSHNATYILS
jgi:hypothetical protein